MAAPKVDPKKFAAHMAKNKKPKKMTSTQKSLSDISKRANEGKARDRLVKMVDKASGRTMADRQADLKKATANRKAAEKDLANFRKQRESIDEISRSMTPMSKRFGKAVDPKKFDAYKKHVKQHKVDEPTVRFIDDNPNHREAQSAMKNKHVAQAVKLYKAAHKESVNEGHLKKGQTVTPTKGPHKGVPHEIIHDFGDGHYNIKPKNMPASRIKYRLGAARAHKRDLKELSLSMKSLSKTGLNKKAFPDKDKIKKDLQKLKKGLKEKLSVSDGMGAWVDDFQKSDAPQFKGKSDKERREMAIAAYLSAKRGDKKEEAEKVECPKCKGEGCDHCDNKGYHMKEVNEKKITLTKKVMQRAFDKANKTAKPKSQVSLKKAPFKIPKEEAEQEEGYVSMAQQRAVWATRKDGGKGHPDNKKKKGKK